MPNYEVLETSFFLAFAYERLPLIRASHKQSCASLLIIAELATRHKWTIYISNQISQLAGL